MPLKKDFSQGLIEAKFPLTEEMLAALQAKNWKELDQILLQESRQNGLLRRFLSDYLDFQGLEHIIAIRSAPEDEDGIWHDDGSRILGFSLSLTVDNTSVLGGHLEFRRKGTVTPLIVPTRPIGTILLFLTGIYGYEHRVTAVTKGERIVIAGWCQ